MHQGQNNLGIWAGRTLRNYEKGKVRENREKKERKSSTLLGEMAGYKRRLEQRPLWWSKNRQRWDGREGEKEGEEKSVWVKGGGTFQLIVGNGQKRDHSNFRGSCL